MRLVTLFAILILSVSCGKDGGGSSSSSTTSRRGLCDLNGSDVACETIQGADGEGIDLLESAIDVPVKIQGSDITFMSDKSSIATGRRINCKTAVKNGEVYRFALRGDKLLIMNSEGSYEMSRLSDGEGINGAWMWKGYIEQGTHVFKKLTIINDSRAILRTTCEL